MDGISLIETADGLTLTDGELSMTGDLMRMLPRLKPGRLREELLVKAARQKGIRPESQWVIDATAGLGEDGILLAAAGYRVTCFEYDPVIAALFRDSLERAAREPELQEIVSRMTLREENSISALHAMAGAEEVKPDIVYLDPMFPERQKTGMIKKKFQLLQKLERPCGDEEALVRAAIGCGAKRLIIKRPLKGPALAGLKADFSVEGKAIRYDVILNPAVRLKN